MEGLELATERTRMRPLTLADVDFIHGLSIDPAVRKYLWDDVIISRDRAAEVVAASCETFAARRYGLWAIHPREGGDPIGFCGLRPSVTDLPELLYGLRPAWWGHGLATETARAVLRHAFALGHESVEAATDPPNGASIRVMERLGMSFSRRGRVNGLDTVFYRLTRDAFERASIAGFEA